MLECVCVNVCVRECAYVFLCICLFPRTAGQRALIYLRPRNVVVQQKYDRIELNINDKYQVQCIRPKLLDAGIERLAAEYFLK